MIASDEDALICDLAETYGIFDYKSMPVKMVAKLAAGLGESSRIKKLAAGIDEIPEQLLLPLIADQLSTLVYMHTRDAEKGINRPKSILNIVFHKEATSSDVVVFDSGEAFEEERRKLIEEDG